jgi:manganese efflux pump family protein
MLGLLLVAAAVGLSNFAASIGIGLSGVNAGVRIRVAVIFGVFEAVMPIVGLVIGHRLAASFGSAASYIGGGLLIAIGIYSVVQARWHRSRNVPVPTGTGRLIASGAALSIDNLVVGFALGTYKVSVVLAAVVIAVVSVGMSLIGLELGHRLGAVVESRSAEIGGGVLVVVGAVIAAGVLS